MLSAIWMAWIDLIAEILLPFMRKEPTVGIASSVRITMIDMTISNSIKVKPLGGELRRVRYFGFLQFITFQFLSERPKSSAPSEKILQRMDAKGKWNARDS